MPRVLDDIAERCELVIPLGTVHPVIYGDKVNVYLACLNICNHPLKIGAVEISS